MSEPALSPAQELQLHAAVLAWRAGDGADAPGSLVVREVEVLRRGRPGVLDVIAEVDGERAHLVLGVRTVAEEVHPFHASEVPVLGPFTDDDGEGVLVEALGDSELAPLVLDAVLGRPDAGPAFALRRDEAAVTVGFEETGAFSVFPWLFDGAHPGVEYLVALDRVGFNHLAAPLALWQRGGRDLGLLQEVLPGTSVGWALADTSLHDLYARGGRPEDAGSDFAPEARALGTMTARMHLASAEAFGRSSFALGEWMDRLALGPVDEQLAKTIEVLRDEARRPGAIRTQGDFHLGRLARTDHGWVVSDFSAPARAGGVGAPLERSPLGDVADLVWSLSLAAHHAAAERDWAGDGELAELAASWEERNRRSVLEGYFETPGVAELVGLDGTRVDDVISLYELARTAARLSA